MIEECNQEKDQKKEKKSSRDTIDSFFGSHDFNTNSHDQETNHDYKQTEQLIDKLLDEKSSNNTHNERLTPTVDIVEDRHEKNMVKDTLITEEENSPSYNAVIKSDEKEEIFEIDQPDTSFPEKEKIKNSEKKKDNQKIDNFLNNEKPELKKETKKKKSFSFQLPKLNSLLGKNKDQNIKDPKQKVREKELTGDTESQQFLETFEEPQMKEESKHEIFPVEKESDTKNQKSDNVKKDKTKKNLFFKSKKDPFHIFKKSDKKQESNQSRKEPSNKKSNEKNSKNEIQHQITTSDGPIDEEVIELLKITDDLLGKLPDEVIEEFSQSDDFSLYEKVMKKYEILK